MSVEHSKAQNAPKKSSVPDWDIPCLNCGRYGTIPGQMMTDAYNNTFCSPDCGWSHILRPSEQRRAAKAAAMASAMHMTAAHPRQRRHSSRRSSRSSRQQAERHRPRPQAPLNPPQDKDLLLSRDDSSPPSPTSARKPPRVPSKSSKRVEEDRSSPLRHSSNAMFEFTMMTGAMDMH